MKRRRLSVVLSAALILSIFVSTADATSLLTKRIVDVKAAETAGNVIGTAANKEEFNALLQRGMRNLDTDFIIQYTGSDYRELFQVLKDDVAGTYFYGMDYHQWLVKNVNFTAKGKVGALPIRMMLQYHHTAAEENRLNEMVEEVLKQLISPEMTSIEKVDAVHDYIVLTSSYTKNTGKSPHSPYTLMMEGGGVCQAYSTLAYKMFEYLGFEVKMVTGRTDEDHAWLKLKIDGEWYNLDITYDDPMPNRKNEAQRDYLLVSDVKLAKTHQPTEGIPFPSASSTKYDSRAGRSAKIYTDDEVLRFMKMETAGSTKTP